MRIVGISLAMAVGLLVANAVFAADCCVASKCCQPCCSPKTCRIVCEMKEVKKTCWVVECEEFCTLLPGCKRGCKDACSTCGEDVGCCDKKSCQVPPKCGKVRCKKKLVKKTYTCKVPVYKCIVTSCGDCDPGCCQDGVAPIKAKNGKNAGKKTTSVAPLPPIYTSGA